MANFNQFKDYAEERTAYIFLQNLFIRGKIWVLIIPVIIIGGCILAWAGQVDQENLNYTWNKIHVGQKLYAEDIFVTDSSLKQFHTYQLVRPINGEDVEKMHIPQWKKLKLLAQLDTSVEHAKPVMLASNLLFLQDDMFKKNTAQIGTYVSSDSTHGEYGESIYIPLKWHMIKPNYSVCDTNYKMNMPEGYTLADKNYYVKADVVRATEPNIFKNKKN